MIWLMTLNNDLYINSLQQTVNQKWIRSIDRHIRKAAPFVFGDCYPPLNNARKKYSSIALFRTRTPRLNPNSREPFDLICSRMLHLGFSTGCIASVGVLTVSHKEDGSGNRWYNLPHFQKKVSPSQTLHSSDGRTLTTGEEGGHWCQML